MTTVTTIAWSVSLNGPRLFACLAFINLITFLAYAHDKRAARRRKRRVSESTLHLLALLGGSPAALAAQQVFRHKTAKRSFQLVYWGIVVLQISTLIYLLAATTTLERLRPWSATCETSCGDWAGIL